MEGTTYKVRLTAADDIALDQVFNRRVSEVNKKSRDAFFNPGTKHYYGIDPPAPHQPTKEERAEGIQRLRKELEEAVTGRVMPAKRLVAFPLDKLLAQRRNALAPDLAFLAANNNLHLLRLVLHATPEDKEKITYLQLRIDFEHQLSTLTWSMWPTTELSQVASVGTKLNVAVNGQLGLEVPPVPIHPGGAIGGGMKADISGHFMLFREWRRFRADVLATGQQDTFAQWRLRKPEQLIGDVEFLALVCSPKAVRQLRVVLAGTYKYKPHWYSRTVPVKMTKIYTNKIASG